VLDCAAAEEGIGALALLDAGCLFDAAGAFRIEAVRDAIRCRLHLVPRFRQVIHVPRRGLGGPHWVDARAFDLSEHVRVLPLEPPAGEAELLLAAEQLRRQRLDPSRPLWEMWFLTGLPDQQIGLFVKIHHAIADGMAAMAMLGQFLDPVPDARAGAAPPWTPGRLPSVRELLADSLRRRAEGLVGTLSMLGRPRTTLRQAREAWPATRELLAEEPAPRTSLDRLIGPDRNLALVRGSLDLTRKIGRAYDATVNDVLLAVTAGGLRTLLLSRGEPVDGVTVRIYVPVSLRRTLRGQVQGTLIAQIVVPLLLEESDPVRRLQQIASETAKRKARTRSSLGTLFRGRIARGLMLKAVIRQRVNVTSASIPGPTQPLYLAGARMLEVFPVLPLIGNVPIGVGALSYAGTFNIGIAADRDAFPDVDVLTGGVRDELHALEAWTHATRGRPDADGSRDPRGSVAATPVVGVGGGSRL
jgi:diacylglycerol O-acyltransferase / wax synthase